MIYRFNLIIFSWFSSVNHELFRSPVSHFNQASSFYREPILTSDSDIGILFVRSSVRPSICFSICHTLILCGITNTSAHFLPRDAMRKRGLCCRPVSVRLSVRLSITLVYCIQMAEDIVKLLSRPGSPIILIFDTERRYQIPRRTPSAGAENT